MHVVMQAHVITIPAHADRQKAFEEQWAREGLTERLPLHFLMHPTADEVDLHGPFVSNGPPRVKWSHSFRSKAELACNLAHLLLWEKCRDAGEPFLVFEDDCVLNPGFGEQVDGLDHDAQDIAADMVYFGHGLQRNVDASTVTAGRRLYKKNETKCNDCYWISPVAADELHHMFTEVLDGMSAPLDHDMNWVFEQPAYGPWNVYWREPTLAEPGSDTGRWKSSLR